MDPNCLPVNLWLKQGITLLIKLQISQVMNFFLFCRPLLKEIRKSQENKIVIDVQQDRIYDVLKQAAQIGLMREYHSYFLTSLVSVTQQFNLK